MTDRFDLSRIAEQRFSYQKILELEPDMTYERLRRVLAALCEAGAIVPVKSSKKTSFVPSVYREYRKVPPKADYRPYLPEIGALHPSLSIGRYLGKPEEYVKNRDAVRLLSEFLWRCKGRPEQERSVKERSYEIWKNEKFLESREGRRILVFNGLDAQTLNYYYAPEPFFFARTGERGNVLVIENKDAWYSIGRALKRSGGGTFCGEPIFLLIYGEGNKVTRPGALTQFLREEGVGEETGVYYAGDIDCAGIDILYRVTRHNPDSRLKPFAPLYEEMARRGERQVREGFPLEVSEDERSLAWEQAFLELFPGEEGRFIRNVLEENLLIPQEILAYPDYEAMCREKTVHSGCAR